MAMTCAEIRKIFLDYFQKNAHTLVASSSLVPADDPTLLFTNAGMVQFKDVFLGKEVRPYNRAVTVQRCLRAGGKHNDLENVGYTNRHHTFFEMLGNFSFGDYFKREAIKYAWDFLTKILLIPEKKLWVTAHEKDQETADIWLKEMKIDPAHFGCCGDKDNFWSMGETGPCGYCSEIFYDHDHGLPGEPPSGATDSGERYVEIWNLVFMQFDRDAQGNLTPLPKPSVDTGMGLERIAAVMQGVYDNYKIDIFTELGKYFDRIFGSLNSGASAEELRNETIAKRVVADHIRAAVFLIADGVFPSNEGRGYVLRRIIRRAVYHLYNIGVYSRMKTCFAAFADPLIAVMQDFYPELDLKNRQLEITKIITKEEEKFLETITNGLSSLENFIREYQQEQQKPPPKLDSKGHMSIANQMKLERRGKGLPGVDVFYLHDTCGLPDVITEEICRTKYGLEIDREGFEAEREKYRELSRRRTAGKFSTMGELKLPLTASTEFLGYDSEACKGSIGKISALFKSDGTPTDFLATFEDGIVVLDKTPFYAESGGQVGDTGWLTVEKHFDPAVYSFTVSDTKKYGEAHLHFGRVEHGPILIGERMISRIDLPRRQAIRLNHSVAHLLHKALQIVLGKHATQRGSAVDDKRLRFDFAHFSALKEEEKDAIEKLVNEQIHNDLEVKTEIKTLEDAKNDGALALFGEKYGDTVRVVKMGDFSQPEKKPPILPFTVEFCGGTHVSHTGEITFFKIISESALASGIRRIEAVTGGNACQWFKQEQDALRKELKKYQDEKHILEKELFRLKNEMAVGKSKEMLPVLASRAQNISGINVLAEKIPFADNNTLRLMIDALKQKLQPAVIVLAASVQENKIIVAVGVSKDISAKINASTIMQNIANQIGGSGGGRPDFAQGGGTDAASLDAALVSVYGYLRNL